jgi:hypothetical protein
VKRLFRPTTLSRALAVFTAFACIAVAVMPMPRAARGAGSVSLVVVSPENSGHVSAAILAQVAQAMYDGVVATGRYEVRGGGPVKVQPSNDGDVLTAALSAGSHAGAQQVVTSDVIQTGDGKIVYRMSIYHVDPVVFGRSQVFQQHFPPSDPRVFASQFGTDLAALEAPRTPTGTIYQVTGGILADTGSSTGFHLGQRFNVVRNGKKVAEAQIAQISDAYATMQILNPSPGFQPQIGDLLISQEPGPAIPPATGGGGGGNSALSIIALLAGVGAALLAIGHGGSAATVNCPGPTPSGAGCATTSPTGAGSFTVIQSSLNNSTPLKPIFQFTFSKPVLNAATFNFSDVTLMNVQAQPPPPSTLQPAMALNTLGGASASFDATGTVMTVTVNGSLTGGFAYFINFLGAIHATDGTSLVPTSIRYPSIGTLSSVIHPLNAGNGGLNVSAPGNPGGTAPSGGAGSNGGGSSGGAAGGSKGGPKPGQPGGGNPRPGGGPNPH